MSNPIETYEHAGLTVELHYDDDYDSSMALDDSRVGTMWIRWNRYTLGDMQDEPDFTVPCVTCEESGFVYRTDAGIFPADGYCNDQDQCPDCESIGKTELPVVEWIKAEHGSRVVLPLSIYEHSGITLKVGAFSDPWDSGSAGYIFDTPTGVKQCLGDDATDEQIEEALRGEVSSYDDYLTGQVYGYVIEDEHGEHVDSCWGFVGDLDYVRTEANSQAEWFAKDRAESAAREAVEVAHWAARDVMTEAPR